VLPRRGFIAGFGHRSGDVDLAAHGPLTPPPGSDAGRRDEVIFRSPPMPEVDSTLSPMALSPVMTIEPLARVAMFPPSSTGHVVISREPVIGACRSIPCEVLPGWCWCRCR